ncbi:antitermination protein [Salmonella enterica]|uniref:Antitermination protein n=2 Tax=Salmonella enterica TaxID=28901 RepID=A0A633DM40_SALER|nr:antitermination protein [Salmonella enterica]EAS0616018.1 antitermination protein [Salmonella enterica subsp. enterica serovar Dahomey]EBQ9005195.1 antitermination protein [Salmonella enterica subsp. enterica serovar Blockley]EBQ9480347.1 antitermination protein [Salmonella enterica subsp. enterica serovar Kokomlemle]EBS0797516.1 antitermination protein [Salmonella enterica subsp. enterica serovar Overschie]EBZ5140140.1 antitermination protein [Salmonella enterica subsp. enterica serovar An
MRDIQQVLERCGAWVANNREDVTWSTVAAGYKGLITSKVTSHPQCCDDDAMIICGCMARLNKKNADMHELLMDYYVFGMTFISLARKHGCSDTHIGKKLSNAEGVIEGMLMALDVKLEMDRYVQREPVSGKFASYRLR